MKAFQVSLENGVERGVLVELYRNQLAITVGSYSPLYSDTIGYVPVENAQFGERLFNVQLNEGNVPYLTPTNEESSEYVLIATYNSFAANHLGGICSYISLSESIYIIPEPYFPEKVLARGVSKLGHFRNDGYTNHYVFIAKNGDIFTQFLLDQPRRTARCIEYWVRNGEVEVKRTINIHIETEVQNETKN